MNKNTNFHFIIIVAVLLAGCQPSKKAHLDRIYLQGIDTSLNATVNVPELQIQKGDILAITVYSDNIEATMAYNQLQTTQGALKATGSEGSANQNGGYLVDEKGNILFHDLGPVSVAGLTKSQAKASLEKGLEAYLKHPYVEIRFLNKKVTIIGEVNKPGLINMPEAKLSILDALALSGDITSFGRKDNVLIVREENGKRTMQRLDIKDPAIYHSDFFYLHSEDMVYVEPLRKKPIGTDQILLRNISIATAVVSTLALVYSILRN